MLPHDLIRAPGAEPERAFVFVHGILGTRANWRGLARRLVAARPEFMAVTVDLPMHGDAQGFSPPWDLSLCARELAALVQGLPVPLGALSGHSFGGKAVLAAARALPESVKAACRSLWIFDSPPGLTPDPSASDSHGVIETLRGLPRVYASREAFTSTLQGAGLSAAISTWLAMNLRRQDDAAYNFGLNLEAIEAMLHSYFECDAWPWLTEVAEFSELHFVEGARSKVYRPGDRERLRELDREGVLALRSVDAGHWLHAEAPQVVHALLCEAP